VLRNRLGACDSSIVFVCCEFLIADCYSFTLHAWIINSCLVTGHALAAKLILQSTIDSRRLFT